MKDVTQFTQDILQDICDNQRQTQRSPEPMRARPMPSPYQDFTLLTRYGVNSDVARHYGPVSRCASPEGTVIPKNKIRSGYHHAVVKTPEGHYVHESDKFDRKADLEVQLGCLLLKQETISRRMHSLEDYGNMPNTDPEQQRSHLEYCRREARNFLRTSKIYGQNIGDSQFEESAEGIVDALEKLELR